MLWHLLKSYSATLSQCERHEQFELTPASACASAGVRFCTNMRQERIALHDEVRLERSSRGCKITCLGLPVIHTPLLPCVEDAFELAMRLKV